MTRAIIRFATREEGVSFSEHPKKWHAQLYRHNDGYPEGSGLDIADSIINSYTISNLEIDSLDTKRDGLNYIYYIWQSYNKSTWISIFKVDGIGFFDNYKDECIFVGTPADLQSKYEH